MTARRSKKKRFTSMEKQIGISASELADKVLVMAHQLESVPLDKNVAINAFELQQLCLMYRHMYVKSIETGKVPSPIQAGTKSNMVN